jgi:hypothetical protein
MPNIEAVQKNADRLLGNKVPRRARGFIPRTLHNGIDVEILRVKEPENISASLCEGKQVSQPQFVNVKVQIENGPKRE